MTHGGQPVAGDRTKTRPRLLVVDDDRALAEAVARQLEQSARLEVVGIAHNADSGCKLALLREPHLVLLDVCMPGRCSFDACREIVDRSAGQTRVLLYAEQRCESYVDRALDAGAAGLASKRDETLDELVAVIESILGGGRYISPRWQARLEALEVGAEPLGAAQLTSREVKVLLRLAEGQTVVDLARDFEITASAVYHTIHRTREKLACETNEHLMVVAVREGIVPVGAASLA